MGKTYLVAGTPGPLMNDLAHRALTRGDRVLAAIGPGAETPPLEQDWKNNLRYHSWNPRSPLSTRTLVLEGTNNFQRIDEAFILFAPAGDGKAFHELSTADIEETLDIGIKGVLFLVKELFGIFLRQKGGTVSFVYHAGDVLPPLQAAASGAFHAVVASLFAQYRNEPILVRGFHSSVPQTADFAEFLLGMADRPDKTSGRWFKYSGRSGLFSFGRK